MKKQDHEVQPLQVAIIARDGTVQYRALNRTVEETEAPKEGKLIFPFQRQNVHSTAWKASEHTRLIRQDEEEE